MCIMQTHAHSIFSVVVFILMRFRLYTPTGYMYVYVSIHCQKRFQIGDVFSMKTLGASVWTEGLSA